MNWEWRHARPEDAGFDRAMAARLQAFAARPEMAGLHGVVVARDDAILLEAYFEGPDECWGRPLGAVAFGPETLHDVRSVSKSVVALLYGIALGDGRVPPPETPLVDAFPEYADLVGDEARRAMTLHHALTMTLGIEWDESLSYADPRNAERMMDAADDTCRFILERPRRTAPGTEWRYCGGATALLAQLIARGTGMALLDYARARLFTPLGIEDVAWTLGSDGEAAAASGLRMRPRDLARIGRLVNECARGSERDLLPPAWIEAMLTPHVVAEEHVAVERRIEYGYQWWIGHFSRSGRPWYGAFGNGGQRLVAAPGLGLSLVVTAGNYNAADAWRLPVGVFTDVVLASLVE